MAEPKVYIKVLAFEMSRIFSSRDGVERILRWKRCMNVKRQKSRAQIKNMAQGNCSIGYVKGDSRKQSWKG